MEGQDGVFRARAEKHRFQGSELLRNLDQISNRIPVYRVDGGVAQTFAAVHGLYDAVLSNLRDFVLEVRTSFFPRLRALRELSRGESG